MNMKKKQIKNYPGYLVYSTGFIYSEKTKRFLRPANNGRGYLFVHLCSRGKTTNKYIHRLVAEAFIKNNLNKYCVNHKNGIKIDNRVDNLEWTTRSENQLHAFKMGLQKSPWEGKRGDSHPSSIGVLQIKPINDVIVGRFGSISIAAEKTLSSRSGISAAINGKQKIYNNYFWRREHGL